MREQKGEKENSTAPANCPPETGWTRSEATEGVDKTNSKQKTENGKVKTENSEYSDYSEYSGYSDNSEYSDNSDN